MEQTKPIIQKNVKIALIIAFSFVAILVIVMVLDIWYELTAYAFLGICVCPGVIGLIIVFVPVGVFLHNVRMRIKDKEDKKNKNFLSEFRTVVQS